MTAAPLPLWPGAAPSVLGFTLDLLLAAILGGAIGLQRQAAHKPAGFRTHLLVALGACGFMEVSRLAGDDRIASNIITGVGFLGAGAIVREGSVPRGLTSAASIWTVAAIGMALGFGTPLAYVLAAMAALLVFVALSFSDDRLRGFVNSRDEVDVAVTFDAAALDFDAVAALFTAHGVHVARTDRLIVDRALGELATWHLVLRARHKSRIRDATLAAARTPGIARIETVPASQP